MAFICGSGNQEDAYEDLCILQPSPQRKLARRRHSFSTRTNKDSKNPYSSRGLDKFEALLADLDGKRQKIYTQKGSEDISLVRFMYTNANDVKPIVVKIKDPRKQEHDSKFKHDYMKTPLLTSPKVNTNKDWNQVTKLMTNTEQVRVETRISFDRLRSKVIEWWRPWYSLPLFVILILLFLVFFGRSFTILCTSIGWYMVPTMNKKSFENMKRSKKTMKKEYSRKPSEKEIMSPRSVPNSGPMNPQPHRKSF